MSELGRDLERLSVLYAFDLERTERDLARHLAKLGASVPVYGLGPLLRQLESAGLVESRSGEGQTEPTYALTSEGQVARESLARLGALSRGQGEPTADESEQSVIGGELAAEREALAAQRQEFERLKRDLLSKISHELRTPLTLVRTSIGLLLDADPDPMMRERLLRNIKGSADRMHGLVTDMLDLVRLGSGRVEYQFRYLDARDLVEEAARLMRPLLHQKKQDLEIEMPRRHLRVLGDRRRIEQVLLNLLSNANKFSPEGTRIRVSASASGPPDEATADAEARTPASGGAVSEERGAAAAMEDWGVVIAVADTGPGIAPEAIPHLFEQYFTERTSSGSHNVGAGLGLPISQAIVHAHGGEIRVESTVGQGTTFLVYLPSEGPDGAGPSEVAGDGEPTSDESETTGGNRE